MHIADIKHILISNAYYSYQMHITHIKRILLISNAYQTHTDIKPISFCRQEHPLMVHWVIGLILHDPPIAVVDPGITFGGGGGIMK